MVTVAVMMLRSSVKHQRTAVKRTSAEKSRTITGSSGPGRAQIQPRSRARWTASCRLATPSLVTAEDR